MKKIIATRRSMDAVAAGPPWGAVREASSLRCCVAGDPPPPSAPGGWRHPACSPEYGRFLLRCCCYTGQMIYHLEGSLASSAHTGGLRYADVFPPPPGRPAPGGMDLGRGGDVVLLRLRLRYVTAQRGTSATPWRSSYGDTSSLRSLRARAESNGQLAWFWLSDVPHFFFMYVNVDVI